MKGKGKKSKINSLKKSKVQLKPETKKIIKTENQPELKTTDPQFKLKLSKISFLRILFALILSISSFIWLVSEPKLISLPENLSKIDSKLKMEMVSGTDKNGMYLYCRLKWKNAFKNNGIKQGFIDHFEMIPENIDLTPVEQYFFNDHYAIKYKEIKVISFEYKFRLDNESINTPFVKQGKIIKFAAIYYDNYGKMINERDTMNFQLWEEKKR